MRRSRISCRVDLPLLAAVCLTGLSLAACSGNPAGPVSSNPISPTAVPGDGISSIAARPPKVCRGGPNGFPCWTPGEPPPTGRQTSALIDYDEAVSGDLAGNLPYTNLGSVGAGANTIAGTTSDINDSPDIDSFYFDVPAGLAVTQVTFAWDLTTSAGVTTAATSYTLQSGEDPLSSLSVLNLIDSTSPLTLFTSSLPLGPGSYNIMNSLFGVGGIGTGDRSWTAHYTWTITAQ